MRIDEMVAPIVVDEEEDGRLLERYGYVLRGKIEGKNREVTYLYSADKEEIYLTEEQEEKIRQRQEEMRELVRDYELYFSDD